MIFSWLPVKLELPWRSLIQSSWSLSPFLVSWNLTHNCMYFFFLLIRVLRHEVRGNVKIRLNLMEKFEHFDIWKRNHHKHTGNDKIRFLGIARMIVDFFIFHTWIWIIYGQNCPWLWEKWNCDFMNSQYYIRTAYYVKYCCITIFIRRQDGE